MSYKSLSKKAKEAVNKVKNILESHPNGICVDDIAEQTGLSLITVENTLDLMKDLSRKGDVVSLTGKFEITSKSNKEKPKSSNLISDNNLEQSSNDDYASADSPATDQNVPANIQSADDFADTDTDEQVDITSQDEQSIAIAIDADSDADSDSDADADADAVAPTSMKVTDVQTDKQADDTTPTLDTLSENTASNSDSDATEMISVDEKDSTTEAPTHDANSNVLRASKTTDSVTYKKADLLAQLRRNKNNPYSTIGVDGFRLSSDKSKVILFLSRRPSSANLSLSIEDIDAVQRMLDEARNRVLASKS